MADVSLYVRSANLNISQTVNEILHKATIEKQRHGPDPSEQELWENCWVLIETRNQTAFQKPKTGPLEQFQSDFINYTVEELGNFVKQNLGDREDAMGCSEGSRGDYITTAVFGVLDSRTASNDTLLFVVDDLVSPEDEAMIRHVWRNGTRWDEALLRYSNMYHYDSDPTDEDISILAKNMDDALLNSSMPILSHDLGVPNQAAMFELPEVSSLQSPIVPPSDEDRERVKQWYEDVASKSRDMWVGIRLPADFAFFNMGGIYLRGGMDYLAYPDDEFDESGALYCTPPYAP